VLRPRAIARHDDGQSLIELALALPLLLVALLGLVDLGRAYMYTTALSNAAREAALYAAQEPDATASEVAQHACDETGFSEFGAPCASGITVTCTPCPSNGGDVTVEVSYRFGLVSGYLFQRVFATDTLVARASATFPGLGP
jgi:Flp pilus assembly protein TadG